MPSPLDDASILARLGELPGWRYRAENRAEDRAEDRAVRPPGRLERSLHFPDFGAAAAFLLRLALLAERRDHHPDLCLRYRRLELSLHSHDARGVTERDFAFAHAVERLLETETRAS